jgi:hypothetical protein
VETKKRFLFERGMVRYSCPWIDHNVNACSPIDCRCADGRFLLSTRCVTVLNGHFVSSSETVVRNGIKSWKAHVLSSAERQKAIGGLHFSNKRRTATLQPDLEFDNFKRNPKRDIFECISCLSGSISRVIVGIFWNRKSTHHSQAQCLPLNSIFFFSSAHL